MKTNKENHQKLSNYCRNCFYPIEANDKFCAQCGQKNTDGRITVGSFFSEFLSTTLNFDSKIFRTIRDVVVPGKLTLEYFKGKHQRYIHPVRLFLVTILLLVGTQLYYGGDAIVLGVTKYDLSKVRSELTQNEILDQVSHLKDSIQYLARDNNKSLFDSLETALYQDFERTSDSIVIGAEGIVLADFVERPVSKQDYITLTEDELIEKYKIEGFVHKWLFVQQLRILQDNTGFANFFIKNLAWTMFFMMPFLALLLKLFYYKSDKYYVEHLIFSFHTHAFAFLLFTLTLHLAYNIDADGNLVFLPALVAVSIYFFAAVWRVYQQHWGLTLLKIPLINFLYLFLFTFFLIASIFVGLILF